MAKHTLGPWYVDNAHHNDGRKFGYVREGVQQPVGERQGVAICRVSDTGRGRAVAQANAHLIAAAPDLLAALQSFLEIQKLHGDGILAKQFRQAEAPIAKGLQ